MSSKAAELRKLVEEMRALGVTEFDGIKLGPPPVEPSAPMTPEEKREREEEREARVRDIQFAACRVRPLLKAVKK